jgi:hypothetical protein
MSDPTFHTKSLLNETPSRENDQNTDYLESQRMFVLNEMFGKKYNQRSWDPKNGPIQQRIDDNKIGPSGLYPVLFQAIRDISSFSSHPVNFRVLWLAWLRSQEDSDFIDYHVTAIYRYFPGEVAVYFWEVESVLKDRLLSSAESGYEVFNIGYNLLAKEGKEAQARKYLETARPDFTKVLATVCPLFEQESYTYALKPLNLLCNSKERRI